MLRFSTRSMVVATAVLALVAAPDAGAQVPVCAPGGAPVAFAGTVASGDAKTYEQLAFDVAAGTTRIEVTYDWQDAGPADGPLETVLDLGLWDADGNGAAEGFRGWSGSRGGRVAAGQEPVFVQADAAARGYVPGPIEPGTWWVDLGIANVGPAGAAWQVAVTCTDPATGAPPAADPVDVGHVADPDEGWYHGDFHMHGVHSHPRAPEWQAIVDAAQAAGLDFLPITEYVTGRHWDELGAVQRANPDVVVWPGREIITYFGHANALGETPSVLEYRHGHDGATLAAVQERTLADGALFQVNHPEFFPPPLGGFCRGCYFELGGAIDWAGVDTIEILTGPILVSTADIGLPGTPALLQNPFTQPAIDRWEALLRAGHRITAVSGSDSKGVEGEARRLYGTAATAVHAEELSRPALIDAVRAGRAYVRARGVAASPEVELTATAGGATAMMGETLRAARAELTASVRGGRGQVLTILRDGEPWGAPVPVDADPFTHTWTAERLAASGPLGTFWRVDVADAQSLTAVTNPIFLSGPAPVAGDRGPTPAAGTPRPPAEEIIARTGGTGAVAAVGAVLLAVATAVLALRRRAEHPFG